MDRVLGSAGRRPRVPVLEGSAPLVVVDRARDRDAGGERRSTRGVVPGGAESPSAKTEFGIVPIAGGNTDVGLGGGFLTNVARLDPAVSPYAWRLEAAAFITFKPKDAAPNEWANPYQDSTSC